MHWNGAWRRCCRMLVDDGECQCHGRGQRQQHDVQRRSGPGRKDVPHVRIGRGGRGAPSAMAGVAHSQRTTPSSHHCARGIAPRISFPPGMALPEPTFGLVGLLLHFKLPARRWEWAVIPVLAGPTRPRQPQVYLSTHLYDLYVTTRDHSIAGSANLVSTGALADVR